MSIFLVCPSCGYVADQDYMECSRTSLTSLQEEGALSPYNPCYERMAPIPHNYDVNAAKNILLLARAWPRASGSGGSPVELRSPRLEPWRVVT